MGQCRRCGKDNGLIKAHSIPEAFFREHRNGNEPPLIITSVKGRIPKKKSPIGVYDAGILCQSCENLLSPIDSYGIEVLLKKFDRFFTPITEFGQTVWFQATDEIDKNRLLQFLVAVLWRASISTQDFYQRVKLGPYEATAKEITFNPQPSSFSIFDAVLSKWRDTLDAGLKVPPLLDPHKEKWNGVNAYRVYFGEIVAYIKVDKRPFPEPLSSTSILNSPVVRIVSREIANSKDLDVMVRTNQAAKSTTYTS